MTGYNEPDELQETQACFEDACALAQDLSERLDKLQVDYDQMVLFAEHAYRERDEARETIAMQREHIAALRSDILILTAQVHDE